MKRIVAAALAIGAVLLSGQEAAARTWKPTDLDLAQDYLVIEHNKSTNEMVMVIWMAPAMMERSDEAEVGRAVLAEYAMVMVAHAKISDYLEWQFVKPADVVIETASGDMRQEMPDSEVPVMVATMKYGLAEFVAQGLGPLGENAATFVFDGKGIADCEEGVFWVRYAGERYEYRTPVPGCSKTPAAGRGRVGDSASLR